MVASEDRSRRACRRKRPNSGGRGVGRFGRQKENMKQENRNGSGATPRRKFDETYKRHAVELTLHGDRTVKIIAKELGIPAWALYEWRKLYAPRPGDGGPAPQSLEEAEKEIGRLRAELIRMREREIVLKKSVGILSETSASGMPGLQR